MRLSSLLPAASVVLGLTFNATNGEAQQTRYGAFLGTSLASIKQEEAGFSPETSRRIGLQAGLWMNKPINNRLSFQPEVHYTQKGVRYSGGFDEGAGFDAEVRLSLSYLEVPLLLNVNLGSQGASSVRPFLLAGPAFAYKADCSISVAAEGLNINVPCEGSELGDETTSDIGIKSFDVGAMLGGGLAFQLGSREATIGLRYTQGLVSIAKEAESVKNNNFSVLFGIAF